MTPPVPQWQDRVAKRLRLRDLHMLLASADVVEIG
jgi:hypothetical protein